MDEGQANSKDIHDKKAVKRQMSYQPKCATSKITPRVAINNLAITRYRVSINDEIIGVL